MPPLPFGPCAGHLAVPTPEPTQTPAPEPSPHLPHQPPCPPGPVPAATEPSPTSGCHFCFGRFPPPPPPPPPVPPRCAPLPGRGHPLTCHRPQHPLPPSPRHRGRGHRHPGRPQAAPRAPRGCLRPVPPLPDRGAGGPCWVPMARAGCW